MAKVNAKSIGKKRVKMEPIVDAMPNRTQPVLADLDEAISLIHGNEKLFNCISLPPLGLGEGGSVAPFGAADFKRALNMEPIHVRWEFDVDQLQIYQLSWSSGSAIGGARLCKDALF